MSYKQLVIEMLSYIKEHLEYNWTWHWCADYQDKPTDHPILDQRTTKANISGAIIIVTDRYRRIAVRRNVADCENTTYLAKCPYPDIYGLYRHFLGVNPTHPDICRSQRESLKHTTRLIELIHSLRPDQIETYLRNQTKK